MTERKISTAEERQKLMRGITDQVLTLMDEHGVNWTKPWINVAVRGEFPVNCVTGKHYRGINVMLLNMSQVFNGFRYPAWASEDQWLRRGNMVKPEAKATEILFFKPLWVDDETNPGKKKMIPFLRVYDIYNYDQLENQDMLMDDYFNVNKALLNYHDRMADADARITMTFADIREGGDRAFYAPGPDYIQVPEMQQFREPEAYYATVLHELIHWTGHSSRNNRFKTQTEEFSGYHEAYAFEELIAEFGSAFLCGMWDISKEPRADHAQYLNHWKTKLAEDETLVMRACARAQAAVDYIVDLQPEEV